MALPFQFVSNSNNQPSEYSIDKDWCRWITPLDRDGHFPYSHATEIIFPLLRIYPRSQGGHFAEA